jgi:hypothetical protein
MTYAWLFRMVFLQIDPVAKMAVKSLNEQTRLVVHRWAERAPHEIHPFLTKPRLYAAERFSKAKDLLGVPY